MGAKRGQQLGSVVAGLGIGIGLTVAGWSAIGPDHLVFAVVVQWAFLFMAFLIGPTLVDAGRSRYRVRAFEPKIYTLLGAQILRSVLDASGWNRIIRQMRQSESGTSGLSRFLRGTEQSETAHLIGVAATVLLVITTVATAHYQGAIQISLVGLMLHGYPVMIQRIVRFKITNHHANPGRNVR
ncbi:hypothetical protein [Arthrobacter sp. RIT-PI-e]|uniref:glycosyl-4,4'-diaponeurosporenoate acyltransferase CrtO family protein n=1 Tax=Arthrobacter sp. RIT-PI-e TaxID=1681197 RepID=UPI00128EFEE8|nr:hypothetical protein [Arthrobacter sp. RIT-PI-e]